MEPGHTWGFCHAGGAHGDGPRAALDNLGWLRFHASTYVQDFQPKGILELLRAASGANSNF